MRLPPLVIDEAAKIIFEFWERHAQARNGQEMIYWENLESKYQFMWREITRLVLEMLASVLMTDAYHYLEASNGDMGAAFARALRRYAQEVLEFTIPPR